MRQQGIEALQTMFGSPYERIVALIDYILEQSGRETFYVFWFERSSPAATSERRRNRTLLAFATPDAALAFAQRHRLIEPGVQPRLRHLHITHLLLAMLREPQILAVQLVSDDEDDEEQPPTASGSTTLHRADILARLNEPPSFP